MTDAQLDAMAFVILGLMFCAAAIFVAAIVSPTQEEREDE